MGLAASHQALEDLFYQTKTTEQRWQLLLCGVNLKPFKDETNSQQVRVELGIPSDAFVIGHVARFHPQKNHQYVMDIAAEVAKREPKMRLLLVGEGELITDIKQKVIQMGLTDKVIFAGIRSDIARLMMGAMDAFVFPSLYEGLGLVLIEAQAAGLPCILSDVIPEEADVVKPLMKRMSLLQPAYSWAEAILAIRKTEKSITQQQALKYIEESSFNIQNSLKYLENLYVEESNVLCP